jgi:hypothetical protein
MRAARILQKIDRFLSASARLSNKLMPYFAGLIN